MTGLLDCFGTRRAPVAIALWGAVAMSGACTRAGDDGDRPAATVASAAGPAVVAANVDTQARTATIPPGTACDGSLSVVAIRVVDAAGAPVNDAVVELRRVKDGATVVRLEKSMSLRGDYPLIDDSWLARVATDGEAFDVAVASRGRKGVARLMIGRRPPAKCHVTRLSGPDVITLK